MGTFCVYEADSPEAIRAHAQAADLPVDEVVPIADTVVVRPDPAPVAGLTGRPRLAHMDVRSALVGRAGRTGARCRRPWNARDGARARCCSSPARPGSGRPGSPRRRQRPRRRWSCGARASSGAVAPYGPVVAALRAYLRPEPGGLDGCGPLRAHLALLLPELGEPAPASDRATIFEAVRCALGHIAADAAGARRPRRPPVVRRGDARAARRPRADAPGGAGRGDRRLPLRRAAARPHAALAAQRAAAERQPRRAGPGAARRRDETAELLADLLPGSAVAGAGRARSTTARRGSRSSSRSWPAPSLASGRLQAGARGLELGGDAGPRSRHGPRRGADERVAAVGRGARGGRGGRGRGAGLRPAAGRPARDRGGPGRADRVTAGSARTAAAARRFRHALSWEAFYADVPWLRRRALHRRLAEALEAGGGQSMEIATHWLGARDAARAREALVRAAQESEAVYAYRDAASAGRQALELWPGDEEPDVRIEVLERYAHCAELAGELAEAVKAWRELSGDPQRPWRAPGLRRRPAPARRRPRAQGRARAGVRRAARRGARPSSPAAGRRTPPSSASRWPTTGGTAPGTATPSSSRGTAAEDADRGRAPGPARAGARAGGRRARQARATSRRASRRSAAASRWRSRTTSRPVAAELYQRLGLVLYDSADYRRAEEALDDRARALPARRRRGHGGGVRHLPRLRAARARRVVAGRRARPRADRRGHGGLGGGGTAGRDPRLPGQAQLRRGGCSSRRWPRPGRRPLPHVGRLDGGPGLHRRSGGRARRGRRALPAR